MPRLPALGLAALCCLAPVFALAPPALAAKNEAVSSFTLDNGLQVVVIEDHRAPAVVHMVWYKIGAADETAPHSGIAHFLEHLMFQGTHNLAPGEFSATVEALGGNDNAFTSWDYTAYFQRVAADRLDVMMKMEADRMRGLNLSEEDVATEREVILEERSQRTDSDPGSLMSEQMRAAQYLNHPYGRPIIGWRQEMEQLSRQDALDFYKANYAPNNAIVVVAGDVTPDAVKALAQEYYGPLAPSENVMRKARPQEPPQLAERRLMMTDDRVSQPSLARSYLAPERDPGDQRQAAALTILAEYLGGNATTSLLARKMQFEDPVAVYTGAAYDGTAVDDTTFSLYAVPLPGKSLQEVEAAMDKVLADFLAQGIDADDFARIKTQIRAAQIYSRDSARGLAQDYGESLAVGLTLQDVEDWPDILQSITPEEVMAAAKSVLDRKASVTSWLSQTEEAAQ